MISKILLLIGVLLPINSYGLLSLDLEVEAKKTPVVFNTKSDEKNVITQIKKRLMAKLEKASNFEVVLNDETPCSVISMEKRLETYCVDMEIDSENKYGVNFLIESNTPPDDEKVITGWDYHIKTDNIEQEINIMGYNLHSIVDEESTELYLKNIAFIERDGVFWRLKLANFDGTNQKTLLDTIEPISSLKWSPDGNHVLYVSYENIKPSIFIHNIKNHKRVMVSDTSEGGNSPSWSPDGSKIAFTSSRQNRNKIIVYDVETGEKNELFYKGEAFSPEWGNSESLFFISTSTGRPKIFKHDFILNETSKVETPYKSLSLPRYHNGWIVAATLKNKKYNLVKINTENGDSEKIIDNINVNSISLTSKFIYLSVDGENSIKVVNHKGEEKFTIKLNNRLTEVAVEK